MWWVVWLYLLFPSFSFSLSLLHGLIEGLSEVIEGLIEVRFSMVFAMPLALATGMGVDICHTLEGLFRDRASILSLTLLLGCPPSPKVSE